MKNLKLIVLLVIGSLLITACSCSKIKYTVSFDNDGKIEKVEGKTLPLNEGNGWTGIFTDLEPDGQYTVKEISVPDGYTVSCSVNEGETVVPGATIVVTNRKNAPGYELPATGSTGTAPYTTAGAVLMGAALVGGYRRKRRQERRGE